MTGELMRREMDQQPEVLARIVERADEIAEKVRAILPAHLDGIAFVGRGSSDNAAMLGRYVCELSAHRPAGLAAPSLHTLLLTGRLQRLPRDRAGQSGATPEVVATCRGCVKVAGSSSPSPTMTRAGSRP